MHPSLVSDSKVLCVSSFYSTYLDQTTHKAYKMTKIKTNEDQMPSLINQILYNYI